ncbi:alpha/beta hydrolase [Streptomyces sp. NPDC052727]|uniref:alpha/beta fold hydrolase n=1 Tax=Streptomyces sp. NPDC052727 TaxID=3154854 RepID=UPI0034347252
MTFSAALAVLLPTTAGAVATAGSSADVTTKPTIVFVHGAFADSSGWKTDIAAVQRLGYPVVAAPNPLRGLSSDADYIRSVLRTISGPIVLVGHSYGGAVITNAARGVDNVKALVYVGAFVPDVGESIATVLDPQKYPGSLLGPDTTLTRPAPNPSAPGGQDADIYIKPQDFQKVFAADVSASEASVMAATQRPLSYTAETEASGDPAWKTIPSWDLVTLNDKAIPPAGQRFMAERARAHVAYVDSSHAVMVSHPQAVVRIVLDAVRHVG